MVVAITVEQLSVTERRACHGHAEDVRRNPRHLNRASTTVLSAKSCLKAISKPSGVAEFVCRTEYVDDFPLESNHSPLPSYVPAKLSRTVTTAC
jgi:hypothetical protein